MEQVIAQPRISQVSYPFLLSIYIILPIFVVMFLVDKFLLPTTTNAPGEIYFITGLLFGTPHIVASNIILITNREYLSFYRWRLLGMAVFVALVFTFGGLFFTPYQLAAMNGIVTVIHTAKQQLGIGNSIGRLSGWVFETWFWSAIAACVIFNQVIMQGPILPTDLQYLQNYVLIALSCVVIACALVLHRRLKMPLARNFFWANTALALLSVFFFSQGYYLFAVFSSRIIHDITAFTFYIVHDQNRHGASPKNFVYQLLEKVGIGAVIAVPVIAIVIGFFAPVPISRLIDGVFEGIFHLSPPWQAFGFGFVTYIGLIHYYTESFTWKGASPYRKHISFAPLK